MLARAAMGGTPAPGIGEPWAPVIGTDRLRRPFTDDERSYFEKVLRAHDFNGARRYALLFARRLARSNAGAQDLLGRALLRLVRWGWNPNEATLAKRLCRLVWSEWTHEKGEDARRQQAEERFALEMKVHDADTAKSTEQLAVRLADEQAEEAHARRMVDRLRQRLIERKDNVNLIWLDETLAGETDMRKMAQKSGRDVQEFYAASKRRARIVAELLAEDNGVTQDEGKGS